MYVFGVSVAAVAIEEYADFLRPKIFVVVNALTWFHSVTHIKSEYFWGETLTTLQETLFNCTREKLENDSYVPPCAANFTSLSYAAINAAPHDKRLVESLDSFNCSFFIIVGVVLVLIYLAFGFLIKCQKRATALALGENDADTLLKCGPCHCQLTILCCGCRDSCCCFTCRRGSRAAGGSTRGSHTIRASKDQDIEVDEEKPKDCMFHSSPDFDDVVRS